MLTSPFLSIFKTKRPFSSSSTPLPPLSDHQKLLAGILQASVSAPHLLQTHARIFRLNVHNDNLIATRLIGRHRPHFALCILNNLHSPNIFPFNAAIRVLSESTSLASSAFAVFKSLKLRNVAPNDFTFSFLLKACFRCGDARNLWQVHSHVLKLGFGPDESVAGGLLLAYGKGVEDVFFAHKLFDEMHERGDVGWWTCLIAGYARVNKPNQALVLFLRMIDEDVDPTDDTLVSVLSSCSRITEIEKWVTRFSEIRSTTQCSEILGDSIDTVLIYLYGKCGEADERSRGALLFRKMASSGRRMSVVTWNAMISVYAQSGSPIEALNLFDNMVTSISNPNPNHVTMVSVLSACSQVGNLELGKWAHDYMKSHHGRRDVLQTNTILATAFIDMYSKCGSLEAAAQVFSRMLHKDAVIFNAMIVGLAINGRGQQAIQLFYQMGKLGVHPNEATFLGLLSGCVHSGLIHEGRGVLKCMHQVYSMKPNLEHYSCYIDLLGRGGHVDEALEVISRTRMEGNEQVWGALVGACLAHGKPDTARYVARRVVDLDPGRSGGYVMVSNAYASDLRWGEIAGLRGMMKERGVRKQPGCSWISVDGSMHGFFAGCRSHPRVHAIFLTLQNLYREMGFTPNMAIHE